MSGFEGDVMANGIRIHYLSEGEGPLVVLLHGFPETHRSWQLQLRFLSDHGFRVVAPDLRGYGGSERPRSGYDLDTLATDVAAFVDVLGERPRALIGHDWGAAIVWQLVAAQPDICERAVVLDCPPETVLARALLRDAAQRRRSWYVFFFQLPRLPELWLARNGGAAIAGMFRADPGLDRRARETKDADVRALAARGALAGPLAYYRTAFRRRARSPRARLPRPTSVPVTAIWGEADNCVGVELAARCESLAKSFRLHVVPGAGHFVHQERPDAVNPLILAAITESSPGSAARPNR